jgi:peptidoglycan/xylan/chitin deacetylase (PgdA/CDA1 family)
MYHGIESPTAPVITDDLGELVYVLELAQLRDQLDWLTRAGWSVCLPDQAGQRSAVITFDDGHVSNHTLAFPELTRRSLPAVFFITSDWIGRDSYMSEAMLRELAEAGHVIGSHGASHRFLSDLGDDDARAELAGSKARLEDVIGAEVTTISAPGGRIDARTAAIAVECGYTDLFTSDTDPDLQVPGLRVHGRITLRRGYTLAQFARMMQTGRQPESVLRTKGLKMAKRLLGNRRYEQLRASALRVLARLGR